MDLVHFLGKGSSFSVPYCCPGQVTVDKYQPGDRGWTLGFVGYQLLDKDAVLDREEGFEIGGEAIVCFSREGELSEPAHWRGRVDLSCYKGPMRRRGVQMPEGCFASAGFPSDFQAMVPEDQKGSDASTWIFPDARSAEVNFRDLTSLMTQMRRN
jgi:hypothetical protein